jgi:hypothetical protein
MKKILLMVGLNIAEAFLAFLLIVVLPIFIGMHTGLEGNYTDSLKIYWMNGMLAIFVAAIIFGAIGVCLFAIPEVIKLNSRLADKILNRKKDIECMFCGAPMSEHYRRTLGNLTTTCPNVDLEKLLGEDLCEYCKKPMADHEPMGPHGTMTFCSTAMKKGK